MRSKESGKVRYAYGVAMALLLGGTTFSLATGKAGAQVAQNEPGTSALAPRPGAPMSFADLTAKLAPAVVYISTKQRVPVKSQPDPFEEFFRRFDPTQPQSGTNDNSGGAQPRTREAGSLGSGFIISPDGYVVTNNHLIQGLTGTGTVDSVTVTTTDRHEYPARIIGRDETSDLALLKIEGRNLPFVKWGDSTKARVGDWVIAIGNPFALGGTVTAGIVSAIHRSINSGPYDRYIQTDAAINQGNSGGPMFDLNGNVVGINTAIYSPSGGNVGIGFAIPAEQAKPVVQQLMKGERIHRGYLGVGIQPMTDDVAAGLNLPKDHGEIVSRIEPGQPAARAGVQQGDVIVKVNGQDVTPDNTLSYIVASLPVGSKVKIGVIRNGKPVTLNAVLAERPPEDQLAAAGGDNDNDGVPDSGQATPNNLRSSLGLSLQTLTPQMVQQLGLTPGTHGVVVTGVDESSDAGSKGLQPRDVILSIGQRPVANTAEAVAAVEAAKKAGFKTVLLLVQRGNRPATYLGVDLTGK